MKNILSILLLFHFISVGYGQTSENSSAILGHIPLIPSVRNSTTFFSVAGIDDYTRTLYGNVDTVWRKVQPLSTYQAMVTPSILAASDGSFYLSGRSPAGGILTKTDNAGNIEWVFDRYNHKDTAIKFYSNFEKLTENSDGTILIYGGEGRGVGNYVTNFMPQKIVLTPKSTIVSEKSPRELAAQLYGGVFGLATYTKIIPKQVLFGTGIWSDSLFRLISMDSDLSVMKKEYYINSDMNNIIDIDMLSIHDDTFLLYFQGKSIAQPIPHINFILYSHDFTVVKKFSVLTNGGSSCAIADNNSIMIASTISTDNSKPLQLRKIDENGNELWQKVVVGLKDIPLKVNKLYNSRDGGFIITGETWLRKNDGSIDYDNEGRMGFISKVTSTGELQWYYRTGREGIWNRIHSIAETSNGDVITVCNSGSTQKITAEESMEITRLRPRATRVEEQPEPSDGITISPNPSSTSFTISGIDGVTSVRIMNSLGMEAKKITVNSEKLSIDVSALASGVYFVQFRTQTGVISKPIVVSR